MLHPTVFNTSQVCYQLGARHAVMSPGSRNAALTISFARNQLIKKWIIPDERSAAFIALGIAQETKAPVVLCCTSGTALLNYAPAIAEAYYRQIPLIVLSADRPPELIDQRDGQTIRQFEALKNHVKESVQLPAISSDIEAKKYQEDLINAIIASKELPIGPVHANIPFREPFYPGSEDKLEFHEIQISKSNNGAENPNSFDLPSAKKILMLFGQDEPDQETQNLINQISDKIPVIKSPLNNLEVGIDHVDGLIGNQENLVPDLLITSGLSILSKKLKNFIRKHKPQTHLHFDEAGVPVDTFQTNPKLIKASIKDCLNQLIDNEVDTEFLGNWKNYEECSKKAITKFINSSDFSETKATFRIINSIPSNSFLHLSNSMPVRYVDLFGVKNGVICRSNRGTSGIDGCTSTALGNALVSDKLNFLITGDLAFLYDRNAFFHNYKVPNLRVIVMNNQGGGIFRLIDGPSKLPELEDYFETRHNRTAEYICAENQLEYYPIKSDDQLNESWDDFLKSSDNAKVMEIFTDPKTNQETYKNLRTYIDEQINKLEESS